MWAITPDLIKADAKTISEILDTVKYKIDTFQREYKLCKSQIELLLEDLNQNDVWDIHIFGIGNE